MCTSNDRCDNLFTYCLTPIITTPLADEVCEGMSQKVTTTRTNWNDQEINFAGDVVLGLSNGFMLPGVNNTWKV